MPSIQTQFINDINLIDRQQWNTVAGTHYPFTRHEFLSALENNDCLGQKWGWLPHHLAAYREGELVALIPNYIKYNSYGEMVFDWAWAEAYQRANIEYYPKSVIAIPYTPATGPRLLIHPDITLSQLEQQDLINAITKEAKQQNLSSVHWLFTDKQQTPLLQNAGLMIRTGCQFHWENRNYADFEDFLSTLTAKKRKKIKRERRFVEEANIDIQRIEGHSVTSEQWAVFHQFYESTFDKKSGWATLSLPFFQEVGCTMGENILLILCFHEGQPVAASLCFKNQVSLYGRHWGCNHEFHSLHFEACYYQGLEYCIDNKLQTFDPGAQGEHKVSRGFLPTPTYSAHWVAHPDFDRIIRNYLTQETEGMEGYIAEMMERSPYKTT